ncbi:hypothetical protein MLD38_004949 [Melastoma candidum]|uniref:Uncharacterized protein n=1 Tax=Melastoma candidum TaxID=119954 RepID=A0ACB9S7F9_9MYRT|nr:hypothetical protein MLD38_004949 [Melastoma candidum]
MVAMDEPQTWVNLCGKGRDPSKVMAMVSHFLKFLQITPLLSVSSPSWPPLCFRPLFLSGQFLNFRVSQLLANRELTMGCDSANIFPGSQNSPSATLKILSTWAAS